MPSGRQHPGAPREQAPVELGRRADAAGIYPKCQRLVGARASTRSIGSLFTNVAWSVQLWLGPETLGLSPCPRLRWMDRSTLTLSCLRPTEQEP